MAYQDLYELVDVQTLAGQEVLNVYFYEQNNIGASVSAADLIDAFIADVLPGIAAIQVDNVLHTEVRARNLFDDSDRAVLGISVPGGNSTISYLNNFSAVGYSLAQSNGAVKNGAKRYAGIDEGEVVDGIITTSGYITALVALGALLTGTLDYGIVATWLPVIIKRILVSPGEYRLPETAGEAIFGAIVDAVFNPVVTSQTSRKIGVGA